MGISYIHTSLPPPRSWDGREHERTPCDSSLSEWWKSGEGPRVDSCSPWGGPVGAGEAKGLLGRGVGSGLRNLPLCHRTRPLGRRTL